MLGTNHYYRLRQAQHRIFSHAGFCAHTTFHGFWTEFVVQLRCHPPSEPKITHSNPPLSGVGERRSFKGIEKVPDSDLSGVAMTVRKWKSKVEPNSPRPLR